MNRKSLTYFEIDVDYCSLSYGVAPCTASIGVTGDAKCFNTLKTCQDRAHFANTPKTIRFAMDSDLLPRDIEAIPSIVGVSFTPATISLGEDLGMRASLSVSFRDHRHSDTGQGFDKYYATRGYNPFERGTFWGKFRARQPFLRGRPCRLIMGFVGQSLAEMETRHFVMDSFNGPTPDGTFTITAKDVLKLADDDRAQAPRLSNGSLTSDITSGATSAVLSPVGIGNAEYPSSGYVAIGGKEICSFTRSGDTLTLTRAQHNTTAIAHKAEDLVQRCLVYTGQDPADIMHDLLVNYAGVDTAYMPLANWKAETAAYLGRVYTTILAQPVGVKSLLCELIQQTASAMWWDDINQEIRLQVLRTIPTDAAGYSEQNVVAGTMAIAEQPETRVSACYVFYGQRNPLEPLENETNYRSAELGLATQEQADYGSAAIRKIYSRWIPQFGGTIAQRIIDIVLGRYKNPPRGFSFEVFRRNDGIKPILGGGYQMEFHSMQDASGARASAPIQITRINPRNEKFVVEAQEAIFESDAVVDLNDRTIIIDADTYNINLRTLHDSLFPVITDATGITLTVIIQAGISVGSTSTSVAALIVGSWVASLPITIVNRGRIQGRGGDGAPVSGAGQNGGVALYTRYAVSVNNTDGQIWSGGGGGAPGSVNGGSGGAGDLPGTGGSGTLAGNNGTTEAGGAAVPGGFINPGAGGGPGLDGSLNGAGTGTRGSRGAAIDGVSYVTNLGTGDRRGTTIN